MRRCCAVPLLVAMTAACGHPSAAEAPPVDLVIGRSPPQDAAAVTSAPDDERLVDEEPYVPLPGATASPFSGTCPPFDRGAAAMALGAVNVNACKRAGGPDGAGHIKLTYAPSGKVQSAIIDGGPYPGTSIGGCVAALFRNAAVPPFCGSASATVGKSFVIR